MDGIAFGVLAAAVSWLVYVALEPYVRRRWALMLVGWSRLLQGRLRDPHVGRDVLIGVAAAAVARLAVAVTAEILGDRDPYNHRTYATLWSAAGEFFYDPFLAVTMTLSFLFLLYGVAAVVRKRGIAVALLSGLLLVLFADGGASILGMVGTLLVLHRFGLLTAAAMTYAMFLQADVNTFDPARWYGPYSWTAMLLIAALAAYGAWTSVRRRRAEPAPR